MNHYTGVGSRETPPEAMDWIRNLALALSKKYILRSGAADGADTAFEEGCVQGQGQSEIYLPWKGFNNSTSALYRSTPAAKELAKSVHPSWERLSDAAKSLHARNCYQVLGQELNKPSEFLVCWTADGCESEKTRKRTTGGTATAIVLADRNNIPVFNLCTPESRLRLSEFLASRGIHWQVQEASAPVPSQGSLF